MNELGRHLSTAKLRSNRTYRAFAGAGGTHDTRRESIKPTNMYEVERLLTQLQDQDVYVQTLIPWLKSSRAPKTSVLTERIGMEAAFSEAGEHHHHLYD